jgi:uncharacterized membrane protein
LCIFAARYEQELTKEQYMETITSWAKENFDLILLLVSVAGVVISVISVIYEIKQKKQKKQKKA